MEKENILNIIRNSNGKGGLISILEEIQSKYTYLPEKVLRLVAKKTGYSLVDIYGVATFYKAFSLKPRGKHCVSACLGTACHVRGAQAIVEELTQQLGIVPGETTPDKEITFETVNCLGTCALGPIVVSDKHYFANVTTREVKDIIQGVKEGTYGSNGNGNGHVFPIKASCPRCGQSLMDNDHYLSGYPSIRATIAAGEKRGVLRLSSLYGGPIAPRDDYFPPETVVSVFCPHCTARLDSAPHCMDCNAPMASMRVNEGGAVIRICARTGCTGHMLDLNGATA